jgi:hypothetical protein
MGGIATDSFTGEKQIGIQTWMDRMDRMKIASIHFSDPEDVRSAGLKFG